MDDPLLNILFPLGLIVLFIGVFVWISRKLRSGGGSLTTTMLGATDAFYDREKKNAAEVIVEKKAGTKTEEQGREGKPPEQEDL